MDKDDLSPTSLADASGDPGPAEAPPAEPVKVPEPAIASPAPPEPVKAAEPVKDHVPVATLVEERRKRQELERRLAEIEAKLPKPAAPEPINKDEDPAKWITEELGKKLDPVVEDVKRLKAATEAEAYQRYIGGLEDEFRKTQTDYDAATAHLFKSLNDQFSALGLDDNSRKQYGQQYVQWIVATALQNGKNPAEVAYAIARQHGYAPAAPKAAPPTPSIPAVQPTKSLSGVGGKSAPPAKDAEVEDDLLDLRDNAFDKATSGRDWRKFVGA